MTPATSDPAPHPGHDGGDGVHAAFTSRSRARGTDQHRGAGGASAAGRRTGRRRGRAADHPPGARRRLLPGPLGALTDTRWRPRRRTGPRRV